MQQLTDDGRRIVDDIARRHGFSGDAVTAMLLAVASGYGNRAQFNHPEFGGMGQWSSGGMVMIGDMFNNALKGRVSALAQELATVVQGQPLFAAPAQSQSQSQGGYQTQGYQANGGYGQQQSSGGVSFGGSGSSLFVPSGPTGNWWPSDLGVAGSVGSQNNLRYAYFPSARRLALDLDGEVSVYDTGDHQIGGFSQQQGGGQALTFTSQLGTVRVSDLPRLSPAPAAAPAQAAAPTPVAAASAPAHSAAPAPAAAARTAPDEIFTLIEKLADLHKKGVLTDSEFETKKAELLGRL
jgi:hypothetical protein